jgi:hypothetical protein
VRNRAPIKKRPHGHAAAKEEVISLNCFDLNPQTNILHFAPFCIGLHGIASVRVVRYSY